MKIIVGKKQLETFLKRRFTVNELTEIIDRSIKLLGEGEDLDYAIYDSIRDIIKSKKFPDIDEYGDDENYWRTYLKYETPLFEYIKAIMKT